MEQTFITRYTDEENRTVNFERWAYKKANTCLEKSIELLKSELYFVCLKMDHKERPIKNVILEDNAGKAIYKYSFTDFLKMAGREIKC